MELKKNRLNSLTALKGLFCLIIVAYHTYDMEAIGEFIIFPYIKVLGGALGNSFFFVLSGFLVAYNYKEKIMFRLVDGKTFVVRRLVKLYPLYFITNIVALIRKLYISGMESFDLREFIWMILMQSGGAFKAETPYNSVCWFACSLFVCYIVYFGTTYLIKSNGYYNLIAILCCVWGYILSVNEWNFPYSYRTTGEALFNFFIGVLLVELINKVNNHNKKMIYILQFGMLCFLFLSDGCLFNTNLIISLVICPFVVCWGVTSELCIKILDNRILVLLGTISTSIYYWHNLLWKIYSPLFIYAGLFKDIIKYIIYLFLLIVLSCFSYQIIEKRITAWYGTRKNHC